MQYPKAVLFDYGMTLCTEPAPRIEKGYAALLQHAVANPRGITAPQLMAFAQKAKADLGWNLPEDTQPLETWYLSLQRYYLESPGHHAGPFPPAGRGTLLGHLLPGNTRTLHSAGTESAAAARHSPWRSQQPVLYRRNPGAPPARLLPQRPIPLYPGKQRVCFPQTAAPLF